MAVTLFGLSFNCFSDELEKKIPSDADPNDIIFSKDFFIKNVERSYTSSVFHLPKLCNTDEYTRHCDFFVNYFVSTFEHNYIGFITDTLNLDDPESDFFAQRELAHQDVILDFRIIKPVNLMCIIALITQKYLNEESTLTEVFNIDLNKQRILNFESLFEDPELAAMICSNKIYDSFEKYGYKNLDLLKSQIEVEPRNFILLPDGIEFIITKGFVAPDNIKSHVFVSFLELESAKPKKEWFKSVDSKKLSGRNNKRQYNKSVLNMLKLLGA